MITQKSPILDVRSLKSTRETVAIRDGGHWPVLALTPTGTIVAALRGGAGHLGIEGRMEIIRSFDAGRTWSAPNVVADTELDDRNPAHGVTPKGTLILSYARFSCYDEKGSWKALPNDGVSPLPIEMTYTRSFDDGLTWEPPRRLEAGMNRPVSPFGKIVALPDGTILMHVQDVPRMVPGEKPRPDGSCTYVIRSRDDGATWSDPTLIAENLNETSLLVLPGGDVLAVMRGNDADQACWTARSSDGARTWSKPVQITHPRQHPADMVLLRNGDILLVYGSRAAPFRIEGLVSRDGGHTWLDLLLTFSGQLYGYALDPARRTDLGYPSSVIRNGEGVTMYYYLPGMKPFPDRADTSHRFYSHRDYLGIATTWSESELIAALDRAIPRRK